MGSPMVGYDQNPTGARINSESSIEFIDVREFIRNDALTELNGVEPIDYNSMNRKHYCHERLCQIKHKLHHVFAIEKGRFDQG